MKHRFDRKGGRIARTVHLGSREHVTTIEDRADQGLASASAWWQSILRGSVVECNASRALRIVDAFCGPGGLALGVSHAATAFGYRAVFDTIIDSDATAAAVHKANLGCDHVIGDGVSSLVDYHVSGTGETARFAYEPEILDHRLSRAAPVDLFIAGPPCEGHSNLNNHTRRVDPRNKLYLTAVALGVGLGARAILLENVPTVQNDRRGVVGEAIRLLETSGYRVAYHVLKADELGAAQRRQRFFLLGWKTTDPGSPNLLEAAATQLALPSSTVEWAIGDLLDLPEAGIFDSPATLTEPNKRRIDYLFDHGLFDLPDKERPDCHKNGTSYRAVYGRMHWDRPAQTITTGFNTPGQGRYVHPVRRRVITPHEAARLQGFPDWFDFDPEGLDAKRKHLAKWIGDAVHPILGYAAGLAALTAISEHSLGSFDQVAAAA